MIDSFKLTLCLTQDCPLRCRYCYAGEKHRSVMSRETAEKAIDMALQEAKQTEQSLDLGFFGGEPLLEWEQLQQSDAYLRARSAELPAPPRFTLTTNGLLLTEEKAKWLAERRYLLILSVDGHAAMHNLNRVSPEGKGSHAEAERALRIIRTTPGLMSQVVCVVTPNNVHLLREGVQWLAEQYNGMICLNFDYWSEWNEEHLRTAAEQYSQCAELMTRSFREGRPIFLDVFMGKLSALLKGGYQACQFCRMGEKEICVSVDGTLFPCSRLVGDTHKQELQLGHVSTGLDRAKQTLLAAKVRNTPAECLDCELRPHCIHWCGCSNYAGTGDAATPSPAACYLEKHLIEAANTMLRPLRREDNALLRRLFGHLPRFEKF